MRRGITATRYPKQSPSARPRARSAMASSAANRRAHGESIVARTANGVNRFSQYHCLHGYGHADKNGLSAAFTASVDGSRGVIRSSGVQGNYNWDCCGVSAEYRRSGLGPLRTEDQFRFNFTLINIGTFGSLSRNDRIF